MLEKSSASTDALAEEEQKTLLDVMLAKSQTFQTVRAGPAAPPPAATPARPAPPPRAPAPPRP